MDTKALRQKILDLAIRGKLVPQDPNDEPASVLLERIRAEKQQMVKDGKLKAKDIKNDSVIYIGEDNYAYEKFADGTEKCIQDEIPFELPEGWCWCRLSGLVSTLGDGIHGTPEYNNDGEYYFINGNNLNNGIIVIKDDTKKVDFTQYEKYKRTLNSCTILVSINGTIGNVALYHDEKVILGKSACYFNLISEEIKSYLYHVLKTEYFIKYATDNATGSTIKNVSLNTMNSFLIPVPSLTEQHRIVFKINEYMSFVDTIESSKSDLKSTIQLAKAKILDLAIRGKLVPQDPDDEPASVLIERIIAEKEKLIKQGKIKRDSKESVIFRGEDNSYYEKIGDTITCIDDELPFEVPNTWEWCRLESCCQKEIKRGKSPKYVDNSNVLVFAQKCNTKYDGTNIDLALYLDESTLKKYPEDEIMHDNDTVINSTGTGTLGRVGLYKNTDNPRKLPIVPDSHVTVIRSLTSIHALYVYYFLKACQSELEKMGEGSTNQKELKPIALKLLPMPIPPIEEQARIVNRISGSFIILDNIEKSLN